MADHSKFLTFVYKVPKRGILKQSTSFEQREATDKAGCTKEPHFDESNILATLHPADKVGISLIVSCSESFIWSDYRITGS